MELRMSRILLAAMIVSAAVPALAAGDELEPVSASALLGRPYAGDTAPSRIRFINVRDRPVTITWITFEGSERGYAQLAPGQEVVQPTYVAHRWLAKDALDGTPLQAFISTRSAARDHGTAQIALIR
jgi:hypothetical protein